MYFIQYSLQTIQFLVYANLLFGLFLGQVQNYIHSHTGDNIDNKSLKIRCSVQVAEASSLYNLVLAISSQCEANTPVLKVLIP